MNRKLLNLLARNANKGEFKAEGNVVYLYDVIVASDADADWFGGVSAESFVKTLKGMTGDVELRINSPGGDVFGAKAMAQAIRDHDGQVVAHVDGIAASAASFITAVADRAVMAPGSMLMIHKAWTIALGNADDFTAVASVLSKIDGTIAADYAAAAERRGKDAQDFGELMAAETWFTPEEAIAAGLADEQAAEKPKAKVDWDLSAYEHAPAAASATLKIEVDSTAVQAALDEALAKIGAAIGKPGPDDEEGPDDPDEIEVRRRRMAAAIDLRPAA